MTSFGDALPDQLSELLGTAAAQQGLATELANMLAERAALEREYAGRLQAITRKARERRDRRVLEAAVGPEPNRSVSAEEAKDSSLQKYITFVLHTSDGAANRSATLAEQLDSVSNELAAGARKREAVVKKHGAFGTKVLAERDRFHSERTKAKAKYDESCSELESARAKKVSAEGDGKHVDRATKAWKEAEDTMESAKNTYLCAIAVSNRANSHFYKATLPALHDNLQALWTLSSARLVSSLSTASARMLAHEKTLASGEEASIAAAQNVDALADQEFYVKFNQRQHWSEPPPITYEPAPGFYDTEEMKEGDAARVQLQNRLLKARARIDELVPIIEAKRREAEGLERLRAAYEGDSALGNPDDVMDNLLDALRETTALELQVAVCEAEIEECVGVIGEDSSDARPHRFTPHNFTIPTTCGLCQSTMWGISGRNALICKPCGYTCHAKCEAKVPPKCRAGNKPTHRPTGSVSLGRSSTSASTRTTGSRLSMPALASPARAAPPARAVPPPQAAAPAASGTMLYAYDAANEGEVSVQAGEAVEVLADDDGGWLSVRTGAGDSGLVPTSYVDLSGAPAAVPSTVPAAAATQAQGCGEFVVALFDYKAQDDDELDLVAGELVELTTAGLTYADGWAQGIKVGRVGVFPKTYVRPDDEE